MEALARIVVGLWSAAGVYLYVFCWFNIPILILLSCHRIAQLRDPEFQGRVTGPTHAALGLYCAGVYGLLLPVYYFLSVRTRHELGAWYLGTWANSWITISLGVACVGWMGAHWIDASLRRGRLRFGPGWIDRWFARLALWLCVWYHASTLLFMLWPGPRRDDYLASDWLTGVVYPQSCFLGATLIYLFALIEADRARRAPVSEAPPPRRWKRAVPISVGALAALFAPFWLSIPRVTHSQALALIAEHRAAIIEAASEVDLDPALVAGIIYVAQTRDRPRWSGEAIESFSVALWSQRSLSQDVSPRSAPLLNASAGLCQMRPTTAEQTRDFLARRVAPKPWRDRPQTILTGFSGEPVEPWERTLFTRLEQVSRPADLAMVGCLLEPRANLSLACAMLGFLRRHWSEAGHPIDDRPDILATLYNLGYERSKPDGAPQANDFGRRVADFMKSEDCRRVLQGAAPIRG
jgi:hypothetical protein